VGHLFSGHAEDLLLYGALPVSVIALAMAIVLLQRAVSRRLHAAHESWLGPLTPHDESSVGYRAPAARRLTSKAPRSLRWVVRLAVTWAAVTIAFWLFVTVCTTPIVGVWPCLLLLVTGAVASARLVQASLAVCDRHDVAIPTRVVRARTWLLVHHAIVLVAGTGLLAVLVLSNQFFWNAAPDGQSAQLIELLVFYAVSIVAPSIVALGLVRGLQSAAALRLPSPQA
jgi:hypothetical protein